MRELKEDLKNKTFAKVYLFFGEPYLKKHYEKLFKQSFDAGEVETIENADAVKIKELGNAISFFGTNRLIIVRSSGFFDKKNAEELYNLNPSNTIIFIEDKVDKRTKFFKRVKEIGKICEFEAPTEADIKKWLFGIAKKRKKILDQSVCSYFLRVVGNDMYTLENEFEKLLSYSNESITEKDVDEVCTVSIESKIFTMLNAVSNKNTALVLEEYSKLIEDKEEPIKILIMVSRQIKLILRAKALASKGVTNDVIAKKMGVMLFVVRECLKGAKNFKYNSLIDAINECYILDCKIKQGKITPEIGLELFLTKFTVSS